MFDKRSMRFVSNEEINECELDNYASSLVGTAEYVAPEILANEKSSDLYGCDLWALGCILYYFFEGVSPYKDRTEMLIFEKILDHSDKLKFSKVN